MTSDAQPKPMPAWLERPWYPFVAAIYPLWFLYMSNLGQVRAVAAYVYSLSHK